VEVTGLPLLLFVLSCLSIEDGIDELEVAQLERGAD